MNQLAVILMMQPGGQGQGGSSFSFIIMMVAVMLVFYFFMIRPQARKAKTEQQFKEGLKKGDKVVTIGGINGRISEVQERSFTIETEPDNVRLRIEKTAISVEASKALQAK